MTWAPDHHCCRRSPYQAPRSNLSSIVRRVQAHDEDDLVLSQIADTCRWFADGGPPSAQRQAAALAELAHLTKGRTELLARFAGQSLVGQRDDTVAAARDRAVQLCITAGADMSLIERWSRESRRQAPRRDRRAGWPG